jgi:hypothetical protein
MSDVRETPTALAARKGTESRPAPATVTAAPAKPATTPNATLQLGAIKELLQLFVLARRDIPREHFSRELRRLYGFLRWQARHGGIDPERALEQYRTDAAKRRPRLVKR